MSSSRHKDKLFKFIFGNPDHKEWTLSLYNALNGSHYTDPNIIEFTTLDDVIFIGAQNDVSFLVMFLTMNFWEHQSSFNPNMPLRFFIYTAHIYDKYLSRIDIDRRSIYSTKLQEIPTPKCICFYNGTEDQPEEQVLRLSDAFMTEGGDIELTVRMLNINYGHNRELMNACRMMNEYAWLVEMIRVNQKSMKTLDEAVDAAIFGMLNDFELKKFMIAHRAEVKGMYLTDYNEARERELYRKECLEEGREEGRIEGREEGRIEGHEEGREEGRSEGMLEEKELTIVAMLKKNLPLDLIGEICRLSEDAVRATALKLGITVS